MIVGRATPEAQALDEALPRDWYVRAVDYNDNPAAEGFPHHPDEYEWGQSPCYVTIVRTGRKVEYRSRTEEYRETDEPQWWAYKHCPDHGGVSTHDLTETKSAHDGREAARIAARFAAGVSSDEVRGRSEFRHDDDFSFGSWR